MHTGVYQIRNALNGNIYIGSTINFRTRWNNHILLLDKGIHHSIILQNAWRKYGKESFIFEKISFCDKDDLLHQEQQLIDAYCPKYNVCKIAGRCLGRKLSDEHKHAVSVAHKGIALSAKHKESLSIAKKGKPSSFKNCRHTDESKGKMAIASRGNQNRLGSKLSVESILKRTATRIANNGGKYSTVVVDRSKMRTCKKCGYLFNTIRCGECAKVRSAKRYSKNRGVA